MDRGRDFLRSQVNNTVVQHQTFLKNLEDHEQQAEDTRFRDLCSRYIPEMREHQRVLEQYQQSIGAEVPTGKKVLGAAVGIARDLADAVRESDFLRLVGDIVLARQSQDTFRTFAVVGSQLGDNQLQQLGEMAQGHHERYVGDANNLVAQMFVEQVRGTEPATSTARAGSYTGSSQASV